jgi:putative restriction endonuclease
MKLHVYPTDSNWYEFLASRPDIDEVNFWRPGGKAPFTGLQPGDLLLFRLKSPVNKIGGGGFFLHSSIFPANAAWDAFGVKNGAPSYGEFMRKIAEFKKYQSPEAMPPDAPIGCIALMSPFFFDRYQWIDVPPDYPLNAMMGTSYDTDSELGRRLYEAVMARIPAGAALVAETPVQFPGMFGAPTLTRRRIGQGGFRILVTDLYGRRCSVTGEATLPVLEAAHILPVSRGGIHAPDNGLLLRSDIHKLFDLGYVTIDSSHRFRVSRKLRDEWSNGRIYYALEGSEVRLPSRQDAYPSHEFLQRHNDEVFRA